MSVHKLTKVGIFLDILAGALIFIGINLTAKESGYTTFILITIGGVALAISSISMFILSKKDASVENKTINLIKKEKSRLTPVNHPCKSFF
ncbi:MAG: hypothetical protein ACTSUE_03685 [Promethearchaeota archaeon]